MKKLTSILLVLTIISSCFAFVGCDWINIFGTTTTTTTGSPDPSTLQFAHSDNFTDEDIEFVAFSRGYKGMPGGGYAGHVFMRVLVVDREEYGCAAVFGHLHSVAASCGGETVHFAHELPASGRTHPESYGNPAEKNGKEHGSRYLHRLDALIGEDIIHEERADDGGHEDERHEQGTAASGNLFPLLLLLLAVLLIGRKLRRSRKEQAEVSAVLEETIQEMGQPASDDRLPQVSEREKEILSCLPEAITHRKSPTVWASARKP